MPVRLPDCRFDLSVDAPADAQWTDCLLGVLLCQVADYDVKLIEVVAARASCRIAGDHGLTAKATKRVLEYGTQLIVCYRR